MPHKCTVGIHVPGVINTLPCLIILKTGLIGLYNSAVVIATHAVLVILGLKLYAIKSPVVDI